MLGIDFVWFVIDKFMCEIAERQAQGYLYVSMLLLADSANFVLLYLGALWHEKAISYNRVCDILSLQYQEILLPIENYVICL